MANEVKTISSREHIGVTTSQPETDTHRPRCDVPGKPEKIGHNPVDPGYGNTPRSDSVSQDHSGGGGGSDK